MKRLSAGAGRPEEFGGSRQQVRQEHEAVLHGGTEQGRLTSGIRSSNCLFYGVGNYEFATDKRFWSARKEFLTNQRMFSRGDFPVGQIVINPVALEKVREWP